MAPEPNAENFGQHKKCTVKVTHAIVTPCGRRPRHEGIIGKAYVQFLKSAAARDERRRQALGGAS